MNDRIGDRAVPLQKADHGIISLNQLAGSFSYKMKQPIGIGLDRALAHKLGEGLSNPAAAFGLSHWHCPLEYAQMGIRRITHMGTGVIESKL